MSNITNEYFEEILEKYGTAVPGLKEHMEKNILKDHTVKTETDFESNFERITIRDEGTDLLANERIIVAQAGARPVTRIFENKVTTQFLGKNNENSPWTDVLINASKVLNEWIPAVGRIELKNGEMEWVGTGWLIEDGIIVTNAHVAEEFAKRDMASSKFVFKPGLDGGSISSGIDFLKEENNNNRNEYPVVSVLWIAPPGEADVAFLQLSRDENMPPFPASLKLADSLEEDMVIAAIGYPAKDPTIRDQALVISIFGNEVYDRKRLAPGRITKLDGDRLHHDCSTLGGNSGSLLVDLKSGKAVGLHQGGFLDDSANLGVTSMHLNNLLNKVKSLNETSQTENNTAKPIDRSIKNDSPMPTANQENEIRFKIQLPIEITIKIGKPGYASVVGATIGVTDNANWDIDTDFEAVKSKLIADDTKADIINIRKGYRFKEGWITDERVVVVELKEKLDLEDLMGSGRKRIPREINGIGIDVRTAALPDQLDSMGVDLTVLERVAKPAGYKEPDGFDKPGSPFFLGRIKERMTATFHVSPDAGFKNLSAFFSRIDSKLTATIYEWEAANHISKALEQAMQGNRKRLKMVTQRTGVGESDATISAVQDMKDRIGDKFAHVFASTRGPNRLIPNSYHIKVASRDEEEFWLSSGNWKTSNQPVDPVEIEALKEFNREWHAIIKNKKLATLYKNYIDYDFEQATAFPILIKESVLSDELEFFIPEDALQLGLERISKVTYQDELTLEDEELDIQPLLTPDKDKDGNSFFIKEATAMVKRAMKSVYIQNQSFAMTDDNNPEMQEFFDEVRKKQRAIGDVRIIFRDARDFGRRADLEKQQLLIERLKDAGFNVSRNKLRVQGKCHTKGIIIDSKEVLLGSQNLTNGGALVNRDAALLVRNSKVAGFFEKIFLYDWANLAHNRVNERVGGIRRANPGEETPEGFRRVKLSDLIGERE